MKTRKASLALSVVLILAGLNAGCSVAEIRGTVTEMEIEESKKVCPTRKPGASKAPACTTIPKCYEMEVEEVSGKVHEFCVDPSVYEDYRVGDMYPHKDRN